MEKYSSIASKQRSFITNCIGKTNIMINKINKENIDTVLLSGSVARGDYYPGKLGGMIDLTVFKDKSSQITAEDIFGKNEDPDIPFHCINRDGTWFQIVFNDYIDCEEFKKLDESKKSALLESVILFDKNDKYKKELQKINDYSKNEQKQKLNDGVGHINYLLSDYKKDRWQRRYAYSQLHENLNLAIRIVICCLFYINNRYVPAEDRRFYYSLDLEKLPNNYESVLVEINKQDISSESDYKRREKLFYENLQNYILSNY